MPKAKAPINLSLLFNYNLPNFSNSIFFHAKGKAKIGEIKTPLDIYEHSQNKSNGRWNVLVQPYIVGLCPSDQAGGNRDFPPGSELDFNNENSPAVTGHEFVGRIVGGSYDALSKLGAKQIALGDIVVGDINIGCGECEPCDRGDPALFCSEDTIFAGIGSSSKARWIEDQTGRPNIPGAYTEGFMVFPHSKIYKVPDAGTESLDHLAMYSQADGIACAKTSCDILGIPYFSQVRNFDHPEFLIAGAGRLGTWHAAVIQDILPNAKIYIADINKRNLEWVGEILNIPKERRYYIEENKKNPFSRENITNRFGKNKYFDFIIDTAGHGVFDAATIIEVLNMTVAKGGAFCTTSHIGIDDISAGQGNLILGMKRFVSSLSPQNNFDYSIDFIQRNSDRFVNTMREIEGGLSNPELPDIVAQGGGKFKEEMDGTTFYSMVNHLNSQ